MYVYGNLWSSRGKLWIVSTSLGLRGDWIFDKNFDGDPKNEAYNTIINDETDWCCNEQNVSIVAMIVITCNNWLIPLVFDSRVWFIHRERGRNQCGIASMACLVEWFLQMFWCNLDRSRIGSSSGWYLHESRWCLSSESLTWFISSQTRIYRRCMCSLLAGVT